MLEKINVFYIILLGIEITGLIAIFSIYFFSSKKKKSISVLEKSITLYIMPIILIISLLLTVNFWILNVNSFKGLASLKKKQYEPAIKYFSTALQYSKTVFFLEKVPKLFLLNREKLHRNLGIAYLNNNEINKAIEALGKSLELNPNQISANAHLAKAHSDLGNFTKSLEYRKKIVGLEPPEDEKLFDYLFSKGISYSLLDENDKALDNYIAALKLRPEHKVLHLYITTCYCRKKNKIEFYKHIDELIKYNKSHLDYILKYEECDFLTKTDEFKNKYSVK